MLDLGKRTINDTSKIGRKKILFCPNCKKDTIHKYITSERMGNSLTQPMRLAVCFLTLGISEWEFSTYYQCRVCQHYKKVP